MSNKLSEKDSNQINNLLQTCLAILILDQDNSQKAEAQREKLIASLRFNCLNLNDLYKKSANSELPKKSDIVKIIKDYAKSLNSDLVDKNYDDIANIMQLWEPSEIDESEQYQDDLNSLDFEDKFDPDMSNSQLDAYELRSSGKNQELDHSENFGHSKVYEKEFRELSPEQIRGLSISEQINFLIEITPEIPILITAFLTIIETKIPNKRECDNNFSNYKEETKITIEKYIEKFDKLMSLYDFLVLIKVYIENYISENIDTDFCNKKQQLYKIISEIIELYWSDSNKIDFNFNDINHEDFSELVNQLGGKKKKYNRSKKNKSHKKKRTKKINKKVKKSKSHKKKKINSSNKKSKKN